MQVTELESAGLKRAFSVVVPAGEIAAQRDKRLAALARDVRIPGFRPGKVPAAIVRQRYGAAVMGEVLEQSVGDAMRQVISDRGLRPALQPKIELKSGGEGQDLEFRMDLEVMPEVPMPDFGAIELERLKASPTEEQVDKALAALAERSRTLEDIAESRPAAKGEVVICDFTGRRRKEGAAAGDDSPEAWESFPGGSATDMPIEIGAGGFVPGFTEQLEGIVPGETRTITVTFPADYGATELAGKEARFEVTAKALKRPVVPPVDDALAKRLGFEDLTRLRDFVRQQIQGEYDALSRLRLKRALLDKLAEQASFTVPEGMVEAEFAQIWQRVEADMKAGRLEEEDKGKDEATLRAEYRAIAERRIRLGLLLAEIGRTNNIQVTPEELARAMRQEAARYPGQEQQVMEFFRRTPQAAEGLRAPIFEEKVVDFMLELARVTEREVTPEELTAPPARA
ncbi:trigger factor [Caldovatus sediminis]|uniref:Trigger factor n=1 Tax=Caldovatus sediminis TaxID=2041189 RepID=A0A8J2ZCX1_9PROT|nr:trigger factor [Caldovatus sediminis]GGG38930.1 trigger factor [Caldovatus sediminis]